MNTISKHTLVGKVDAEEECPSIPGRAAVSIGGPGWGDGTLVGCVEPVCFATRSFRSNLVIPPMCQSG